MNVAADASPLIPSIIGAIAAVIAAAIAAWAVIRTHTYEQLLKDIHDAVKTVVDAELGASSRGPAIANYIEQMIRRILEETLGTNPQRRRWYDR